MTIRVDETDKIMLSLTDVGAGHVERPIIEDEAAVVRRIFETVRGQRRRLGDREDPERALSPQSRSRAPSSVRARVEKGRLVLDEATTLPDGTVIDLVADDEGEDLTDEERRALHEALSASWRSAEAGRLRPASAILDELRQRR
jgi:hypothetical protein